MLYRTYVRIHTLNFSWQSFTFVSQRTTGFNRNFATAGMARITPWDRLIRYTSVRNGQIHYGEPIVSSTDPDIDQLAADGKLEVKILPNPISAQPTGEKDLVKKLPSPLRPIDVPIIRRIGTNYRSHSQLCPNPRLAFNRGRGKTLDGRNDEISF